jgi:hypothetical protein
MTKRVTITSCHSGDTNHYEGGHVSSTSSHIAVTLALVPAARRAGARVTVWRRRQAWRIDIDEAGVDPAVLGPLAERVRDLLGESAPALVGVHLERAMRGGVVEAEASPHLASVYLAHGAMPPETADHLGRALTYIAHRT